MLARRVKRKLRLGTLLLTAFVGIMVFDAALAGGQSDYAAGDRALQLFTATPATFIENTGQIADPTIRYAFYGSGANVYHTTNGLVFQVFQRTESDGVAGCATPRAGRPPYVEPPEAMPTVRSFTFSASFPGARRIKPVGRQPLVTKINYCLGADHSKWREGVPTFGVLVYEGLYDG
ncbi:MAG TPA: hypothetical protein VM487_13540, partial [Phycisphaerae bacterium]|nr:hypothetical protein [Phycisphaerae bacterium]